MKLATILLALLATTGCATRAGISSAEIGCPPDEIVIKDASMGWQTNTWTAQCRGKTFYCTYVSGYNLGNRSACKEELKP